MQNWGKIYPRGIVHQSNDPTCEGALPSGVDLEREILLTVDECVVREGVLYKWRRGCTQPAAST